MLNVRVETKINGKLFSVREVNLDTGNPASHSLFLELRDNVCKDFKRTSLFEIIRFDSSGESLSPINIPIKEVPGHVKNHS